jgi:PST family polysaccharide transporter
MPDDGTSNAAALSGRAISGVVLLGSAQGVKFVLQLFSIVLLARLLKPEHFGVFAMTMPLVAFVMMFQDFGLSQAVITVKNIDQRQLSSFFYINFGLSVALALLIAAAAPLIGHFYHDGAVVLPLLALAGTVVLSGLATIQFALLVRRLKFDAMALADVAGGVAGFAASIVVAWIWPSVWALVAAVAANMLTGVVCGWWFTRWRPSRPAPLREVRRLLAFGGGVATADFATFISRNADNVLVGRFLGALALGFYDRAYKLLLFPLQQIVHPLGRVTVPILGRLIDEPERYRAAYLRTLNQILLVSTAGMVAILVSADVAVPVAMGEQWHPVTPLFRWLGLVGLFIPLTQSLAWLLISQSRTLELARFSIFYAITAVIGFVAGLRFGITGFAMIFALSDTFIRLPAYLWYVGRRGPVSTGDLYRLIGPHFASATVAAAACWAFHAAGLVDGLLDLAGCAVVSYAAGWATFWCFPSRRYVFAEMFAILARALPFLRMRQAQPQVG